MSFIQKRQSAEVPNITLTGSAQNLSGLRQEFRGESRGVGREAVEALATLCLVVSTTWSFYQPILQMIFYPVFKSFKIWFRTLFRPKSWGWFCQFDILEMAWSRQPERFLIVVSCLSLWGLMVLQKEMGMSPKTENIHAIDLQRTSKGKLYATFST